jgi:lipopolysaccharide export LptBFGC system permease protein LptF
MKRIHHVVLISAIAISIFVVFAVCWHSVEEIHYLKSFYPKQFSVEEAFYATAVELVKIIIISLPFSLVVATSLYVLRHFSKKS